MAELLESEAETAFDHDGPVSTDMASDGFDSPRLHFLFTYLGRFFVPCAAYVPLRRRVRRRPIQDLYRVLLRLWTEVSVPYGHVEAACPIGVLYDPERNASHGEMAWDVVDHALFFGLRPGALEGLSARC